MILLLSVLGAMADDPTEPLQVPVGRSLVITLPTAPLSVAVTDPRIANVVPLGSAETLVLQGLALGSTDLSLVFSGGRVELYDVEVARDLDPLRRAIDGIVEGRPFDPRRRASITELIPPPLLDGVPCRRRLPRHTRPPTIPP